MSTTSTGCELCGNTTFPHVCYGTWQPLPPQPPRDRPEPTCGMSLTDQIPESDIPES